MAERWLLEEWFLPIESSFLKLTWNFLNKHAGIIFYLSNFSKSLVFFPENPVGYWASIGIRLYGLLGGSQVFNQAALNEFKWTFRRSMSSLLETNLSNLWKRNIIFEATF